MADTTKLTDMLDNLIKGKSEQAQVSFHDYLQDKMQEVVKSVQAETKPVNNQNK